MIFSQNPFIFSIIFVDFLKQCSCLNGIFLNMARFIKKCISSFSFSRFIHKNPFICSRNDVNFLINLNSNKSVRFVKYSSGFHAHSLNKNSFSQWNAAVTCVIKNPFPHWEWSSWRASFREQWRNDRKKITATHSVLRRLVFCSLFLCRSNGASLAISRLYSRSVQRATPIPFVIVRNKIWRLNSICSSEKYGFSSHILTSNIEQHQKQIMENRVKAEWKRNDGMNSNNSNGDETILQLSNYRS